MSITVIKNTTDEAVLHPSLAGHGSNLLDGTHCLNDATQPNVFRANKTRPKPTQARKTGPVQQCRTVLRRQYACHTNALNTRTELNQR